MWYATNFGKNRYCCFYIFADSRQSLVDIHILLLCKVFYTNQVMTMILSSPNTNCVEYLLEKCINLADTVSAKSRTNNKILHTQKDIDIYNIMK